VEFPGREKEPARPGQRLQLILTFRDFVGFFLEGAGCLGFCMMKVVSAKELKEHKTWLAIEGNVYDVEDFLESHPGGPEIISEVLGADGKELIGLLLLLFFFLKKKKNKNKKRKLLLPFVGIIRILRLLAICFPQCRWECWPAAPARAPPPPRPRARRSAPRR
jgi:hypothetical protein